MQAARDRQKSYADLKRKPMKFQVGDKVMLKVSPWKGVKCHADKPLAVPLDGLHFDDKLHFVEEPVEIMDREVRRLKQSRIPLVKVRWNSKRGPEFTVHNTFHVSNLKKCHADEPLVVPLDGLHFDDKLQFVEEPVEIVDR
nr:hypothetical protein [Tanacetum cinerariifolium]